MVRLMADDDTLSRKRRRRSWLIAGTPLGLTVLGVTLLSGPSPPRTIVMASGRAGGAYAARLERLGREGEPGPAAGSVDNLKRLLSEDVDVAFVQGGTYPLVEDS